MDQHHRGITHPTWQSCTPSHSLREIHNSEVELLLRAQTAGVNGLTKYLAYEDAKNGGLLDQYHERPLDWFSSGGVGIPSLQRNLSNLGPH